MNRSFRVGAAAVLCLLVAAVGESAAQAGAEIKRFDTFVGKWRIDLDIKATATTQAIQASGTEECELFANMHLVCKADAGAYRSMRVLSYIAALKQYGSYSVDSYGFAAFMSGQFQSNTWTFTSDIAGYKSRYIVKTSGSGYTATSEYAGPDGKWVTVSVAKATKMK